MVILAFLGIIALIVEIFYWPTLAAFFLLTMVAYEYLGIFGVITVFIGALVCWVVKDPSGFLEAIDDYCARRNF